MRTGYAFLSLLALELMPAHLASATFVLADSYVKGIVDRINWADGLKAMLKDATEVRVQPVRCTLLSASATERLVR